MPRAGLSRARVVDEAATLADEAGLDALTLTALARRLGVREPSLYKHVAGLPALRRDIEIRALGDLGAAMRVAAVGKSGGEALQSVALAYRSYARRHPGRYATTRRAPDPSDRELGGASREVLDIVVAVLAGYGLEGDRVVDAARMLRAAIHGFVTLEEAGGFGLPQDVDRSFERMVAWIDEALRGGAVTAAGTALSGRSGEVSARGRRPAPTAP